MHRILIADDDVDLRELLARVLSKAGYRVETVEDGHAAVEMVAATMPDLLITDLLMPHLTGWSVFSRVHRLAPQLPILIISGASTGTPPHATALPHHPMFLRKPVVIDEVLTTVAPCWLNARSVVLPEEALRSRSRTPAPRHTLPWEGDDAHRAPSHPVMTTQGRAHATPSVITCTT